MNENSDRFKRGMRKCERLYDELRKELTMPDWEEMILARQDDREILEDECNGDCDYCPYKGIVPGSGERIDREPEYYCTLFDNEE